MHGRPTLAANDYNARDDVDHDASGKGPIEHNDVSGGLGPRC
jgi:hypothetical protein